MENIKEILLKASRYCAYRERCTQEVRHKLAELGASPQMAERVIAELITKGFINEERFSRMFAGGKFRQKKWGRVKIAVELKKRGLTPSCIIQGLEELDETDYRRSLLQLIKEKMLDLKGLKEPAIKSRLVKYCIGKGFEPGLVWEMIKSENII